jgi:hypothetical protein
VVVFDHRGHFGYRGDDHAHFDGRTFRVAGVTEEGALLLDDSRGTVVAFVGVAPAAGLKTYMNQRVAGREITLKLEPLQTRDDHGRLIASIYLEDSDCLNVDAVREGLASADSTTKWTLRAMTEGAQADAQRHGRGLWKGKPPQARPARDGFRRD